MEQSNDRLIEIQRIQVVLSERLIQLKILLYFLVIRYFIFVYFLCLNDLTRRQRCCTQKDMFYIYILGFFFIVCLSERFERYTI